MALSHPISLSKWDLRSLADTLGKLEDADASHTLDGIVIVTAGEDTRAVVTLTAGESVVVTGFRPFTDEEKGE